MAQGALNGDVLTVGVLRTLLLHRIAARAVQEVQAEVELRNSADGADAGNAQFRPASIAIAGLHQRQAVAGLRLLQLELRSRSGLARLRLSRRHRGLGEGAGIIASAC